MKKSKFIRIIPKLDIKNGQLIKGINLEGLRVLGDPYDFAYTYYKDLADEICYVDNVATLYGTNNLSKFITRTAKNIFIPLTVGGGIKNLLDIDNALKSGADKVSINSAAIENIDIINKAAKIYGSSTIVSLVETIKIGKKYFISKSNGRDIENINPLVWCKKLQENGAGEIFLTVVNNEGLGDGFDISLYEKISHKINIPLVAHGGAGKKEHILELLKNTNVSAVSIASFFHYNIVKSFKYKKRGFGNFNFLENINKQKLKIEKNQITNLKKFLKKNKINVRL